MIYVIIVTPLAILFLTTAFYSRKLLNYVMSEHPTLISRKGKIKICAQASELEEISDNKLTDICANRQMLIRLFIGYAGISFMLIVLYWVYLIL